MRAATIRRAHVVVHPEWGEQVVRNASDTDNGFRVLHLANGMDWTVAPSDQITTVKP